MNSKKFGVLGSVVACVFVASTATAQMRGHGNSMGGMGMSGASMPHSMGGMGMSGASMPHSMGRMPMHRHHFFNDRREDRFEARHRFFHDRREDR